MVRVPRSLFVLISSCVALACTGGPPAAQPPPARPSPPREAASAVKVTILVGAHCTGIEATYRLRSLLHLDRGTAVVGAVGATFDLAAGLDAGDIAR